MRGAILLTLVVVLGLVCVCCKGTDVKKSPEGSLLLDIDPKVANAPGDDKKKPGPETIHTAGDGGLDTEKDIVDVGTHRVDLTRRITHIHRRHQHQLLLCLVLHQGRTVSSGQMSGQNLLISSVQKVRHLRIYACASFCSWNGK